jgi:hypothetical protein
MVILPIFAWAKICSLSEFISAIFCPSVNEFDLSPRRYVEVFLPAKTGFIYSLRKLIFPMFSCLKTQILLLFSLFKDGNLFIVFVF